MRYWLLFVVFSTSITVAIAGVMTAATFHEMQFQTPPGWTVEHISDDQIEVRSNSPNPDILLIRRFVLGDESRIKTHEAMVAAEKGLYSDLGVPPGNDVSLEYHDDGKIVTFDTTYQTGEKDVDNYLYLKVKGLFCNVSETGQVLYLLQYEVNAKPDSFTINEIAQFFDSAMITAKLEDSLYPPDHSMNYLYVLLLLMLAAFFFMRNRRIQNSRNPLGRSSEHFWRCPECRMINHNDNAQCRRCGAVRPEAQPTKR